MKASKVIEDLQNLIDEYGDLNVIIKTYDYHESHLPFADGAGYVFKFRGTIKSIQKHEEYNTFDIIPVG